MQRSNDSSLPADGSGNEQPSDAEYSFDPRFYAPHFQPIIDIPSGTISGFEALARTVNSEGKVVSVGWLFDSEYAPSDVRLTIDRAIRRKAISQFAQDPEAGMLFINISPAWAVRLVAEGETPTIRMIREVGIDPRRVVIEITEKMGDIGILEALIRTYKNTGLKIAIDDFGVGGSQVDRLIALDPDFIKIDMGIFKDAARGGKAAKILMALSSLAEHSSCEIICEGVETEQEFHYAIECGAQKVQGWLFGRSTEILPERKSTISQCSQLQMSYLKRKKKKIFETTTGSKRLERYIDEIVEHYLTDKLEKLNTSLLSKVGILRFFICSEQGKQLSPNYNFCSDTLETSDFSLGWYWSHRPYFPVLVALKETNDRRAIVSRGYVDAVTQRYCKTYGMLLKDSKIMLIDTLADDDVLYCDETS